MSHFCRFPYLLRGKEKGGDGKEEGEEVLRGVERVWVGRARGGGGGGCEREEGKEICS